MKNRTILSRINMVLLAVVVMTAVVKTADARYYDAALGRFLSADSVEGPNRYAYVRNNPVNMVDPTGNSAIECNENGLCSDLADPQIPWGNNVERLRTTLVQGMFLVGPVGGLVPTGAEQAVANSARNLGLVDLVKPDIAGMFREKSALKIFAATGRSEWDARYLVDTVVQLEAPPDILSTIKRGVEYVPSKPTEVNIFGEKGKMFGQTFLEYSMGKSVARKVEIYKTALTTYGLPPLTGLRLTLGHELTHVNLRHSVDILGKLEFEARGQLNGLRIYTLDIKDTLLTRPTRIFYNDLSASVNNLLNKLPESSATFQEGTRMMQNFKVILQEGQKILKK